MERTLKTGGSVTPAAVFSIQKFVPRDAASAADYITACSEMVNRIVRSAPADS